MTTMTTDAAAVHAQADVVLAHLHMQRRFTADRIDYAQPGEDLPGRQVDIPKLRQGGVKCIWLSEGGPGEFGVDPEAMRRGQTEPNFRPAIRTVYRGPSEAHRLIRGWDALRRLCREHAADLEHALTVRQARDIIRRGKIAVFWHTEALLIANDLAVLRAYHTLGLRAAGLVHGAPLDWVDNDLEQRDPGGLTEFGREVVHEMNALGIVIDVSHSSEMTIRHVLEETQAPIVASHSNPKRLSPIQRNLSDELLRGITTTGGVVGIHCSSAFVDIQCAFGRKNSMPSTYSQHRLEMIGKVLVPGAIEPFGYEAEMRRGIQVSPDAYFPRVSLERLVDHIDYLVNLVGEDHVGIGTDFQYLEDAVEDFDSAAQTPNVTAALLGRGYSIEAIHKILGGNFLRVMEVVIGV
jgi:membrane dipeptidase